MPRASARTRSVVTLAAAALGATGLVPLTAGTAAAASSPQYNDFNGDGYRDVAVGAPFATDRGYKEAGAVVITYGSATGPKASTAKTISQSTAAIDGASATGDNFGYALVAGDFDDDGYGDLAVGAPGEDVNGRKDQGRVTVLWGSRAGLTDSIQLTSPGGTKRYGTTLAGGDFNGDGRDDLAVGRTDFPRVYVHRGGWARVPDLGGFSPNFLPSSEVFDREYGMLALSSGDVNGDGRDDLVLAAVDAGAPEVPRTAVYLSPRDWSVPSFAGNAGLGVQTAVGDVDGDGYEDIVTGNWYEPESGVGGTTRGGNITVTYGAAGGVDHVRGTTRITQNTPGVPESSETDDMFGAALAIGDMNRDGYAEIAVGSPLETIGANQFTGMVTVFPGSAQGPRPADSYAIHQNVDKVRDLNEFGDQYGGGLSLTDTNGDNRADLTIGHPGEDQGIGAVSWLRGATQGWTTLGAALVKGTATDLTITRGYDEGTYWGYSMSG